MIGTTLSHFKITAKLGEGGMGEVWQAEDTKLEREVAIKVLPALFTDDPHRLARFEREAKVLASLNHPNIAQIYGFEEVEGRQLLVMEMVPGQTLGERLERGPIPVDEAVPIARQIAEALESAHELGVIHRDLKPANIKITPNGQVKILDFGLAKALGHDIGKSGDDLDLSHSPTLTADMTQQGMLLGTAAYMSPEQAKGRTPDRRADVWAFGVVLWEMLAGTRLFEGEATSEILASVLRQPIDKDALPDGTATALRSLLLRCLDRDPQFRLRDIGEARVALSRFTEDADNSSLVTAEPGKRSPRPRSHWSLGTLVAALAALSAVLWLRGEARPLDLPTLEAQLLPPTGSTIVTDDGLALSPAGRRIAFPIESESGLQVLCVQSLDEGDCQTLEGTDGARYPFWSPDGRHLGFFAGGSLHRIDTEGGPPRVLAPASLPRGGAWCGDRIAYSPRSLDTLYVVPADGGDPTRLTTLDEERGETSHRHPFCLASSNSILMLAQTAEGGSREDESHIEWVSLDTGERHRILKVNSSAAWVPSGHLLFLRDNTLLSVAFDIDRLATDGNERPVARNVAYTDNEYAAFSVSTNGLLAFVADNPTKTHSYFRRVDLDGEALGPPSQEAVHQFMAVGPTGTRVAYESSDFSSLWIRDLTRGTASRFTLKDGDHFSAVWSPEGDSILFATDRESKWQIFRQGLSSLDSEELLYERTTNVRPLDVSLEGGSVAIGFRTAKGHWGIGILDSETRDFEVVVDTAFDETDGHFSPDGSRLAYVSNETGAMEVYALDLKGDKGRQRISTAGGRHPRWSPGGDRLFYFSPARELMSVDVAPDDGVDFGTAKPLFRIPRPARGIPYAVLPDGQSFLLNQLIEQRIPDHITLVQGWVSRVR